MNAQLRIRQLMEERGWTDYRLAKEANFSHLRSEIAIRMSIHIMDTFVEMRKYMTNTSLLYE